MGQKQTWKTTATALLTVTVLSYIIWLWIVDHPVQLRDLWLYETLLLTSTGLLIYRAAVTKTHKLAWTLISISAALWSVIDILYTFAAFNTTELDLQKLEAVYFIIYPPLIVGMWLLIKDRIPVSAKRFNFDLLIAGILVLATATYLQTYLQKIELELPTLAQLAYLMFPLLDIIAVGMFIAILPVLNPKKDKSFLFLGTGFVSLFLTDSYYLISTEVLGYQSGSNLDLGWLLGFICIGLGAATYSTKNTDKRNQIKNAKINYPLLPLILSILSVLGLAVAGPQRASILTTCLLTAAAILALLRVAQELKISGMSAYEYQTRYINTLTGLKTKQWLYDYAQQHIAGQPYGLVLVDIKNFKDINTLYTYATANLLLKDVAKKLDRLTDENTIVVHTDGNEFTIIQTNTTPEALTELGQTIQTNLNTTYKIGTETINITTTCVWIKPTENPVVQTYRNLQQTLYRAKSHHLGLEKHNPRTDTVNKQTLQLGQQLRYALTSHELTCYYQPVVQTTGKLHYLEALVRWNHPTRGLLYPNEFLEEAEKTGVMRDLTQEVFTIVLNDLQLWKKRWPEIKIGVNITEQDLEQPDFCQNLLDMLHKHKQNSNKIILEVVETTEHERNTAVTQSLKTLAENHITIAIDDYGTGRSTLSKVRALHAQELKIDRSFITNIHKNPELKTIVENTVKLAKQLNLKTVAEGVETVEEKQTVAQLDVDYIQGYYISKPLDKNETAMWLRANQSKI